jgi:hypothetical protein
MSLRNKFPTNPHLLRGLFPDPFEAPLDEHILHEFSRRSNAGMEIYYIIRISSRGGTMLERG